MGSGTDITRPDADALLEEAAKEGRGRLKVYLGMAPGVGKTYAMLEAAQRLKASGCDVVIGVVEPHGRSETQALVAGLETLPRRKVQYRGVALDEFDIDTALARHPKLLIVDEFAHTNAPDSRHPKRWQDIEELLRAGIDVYTALNVQHVESLNDIVARVTGIRVQEVLPDAVLEKADDVELVDLTPQELIERLEAGKVYVPQLAGKARESFFRPGNLSALRELALRRTAQTVDTQMLGYMRTRAIDGPWPVSERIMVCVGPGHTGPTIVRAGHNIAAQLKAPWTAVTIERTGADGSDEFQVNEALTLAERLGAKTERLAGTDLPGEILAYARRANITQIVIGRSRTGWLREFLRRSLVHELVRRSDGIAVHVVMTSAAPRTSLFKRIEWPRIPGYAAAILSVAGVVALTFALPNMRTQPNASMLFLAAVMFSAIRYGHVAGLLTALLSFCAYNFFFTRPYHTLRVEHWQDIITLFVFLIVAATTGTLAGRVRDQMRAAKSRMTTLQLFYDFSRRLGAAKTADDLLHTVVLEAQKLSACPAMMLLPGADDLEIRYAWPPDDTLDLASRAAARWAMTHAEPAGAATQTLPTAAWQFRPMRGPSGAVGVLGLQLGRAPVAPDLFQTLDAILDQSAVAVERIDFAAEVSRTTAMVETERFRNTLLSSVSHDLRTPLTSILGSATALLADEERYDGKARRDLLTTIQEEAERLDRFVRNLLDMTRLEAGALNIKHDWIFVAEVIDSAVKRVAKLLQGISLTRDTTLKMPMIEGDFLLLETVLVNLLENAAKHANGVTKITICTREESGRVVIEITDDGTGIPAEHLPKLFDKFYRIQRADRTIAGTGLGLAIAKGLTQVMGGTISVESPVSNARGTRFTIAIPALANVVSATTSELT